VEEHQVNFNDTGIYGFSVADEKRMFRSSHSWGDRLTFPPRPSSLAAAGSVGFRRQAASQAHVTRGRKLLARDRAIIRQ